VAVPTAKATAPSGLMPAAETTAVPPAAETASMPAAETTTVPAARATTVPAAGPVGARCRPTLDAARHPGKSGPGVAEMTDRCPHSDACEPASHVTAIPRPGPDGGEGQDGRTDKERENREPLDISDVSLYLDHRKKCTTDIPIMSATAVASAA
jgi:hypothetical protein